MFLVPQCNRVCNLCHPESAWAAPLEVLHQKHPGARTTRNQSCNCDPLHKLVAAWPYDLLLHFRNNAEVVADVVFDAWPEQRGVRLSLQGSTLPHLASCLFLVPRTPPPFPESPVFAWIAARACSASDLNVFLRLDGSFGAGQSRGVRIGPLDRLQRRLFREPLSPLVGDTY